MLGIGLILWHDVATGQAKEGIIASLQAQKSEIAELNIYRVDPKACFRHLKGLSTPSMEDVTAIRPIFTLNKDDGRIVEGRDVDRAMEPEANIAAMPWEDFEHLVRQLFEWEFGRGGVEVKVTQASRERGVDAIMFDPDPIRGGKYVLQAKRYTRTVDVAAVRDLYGTVVNEGANRGILVTTSSYGPDAYAFAKDKPLSLIDGPNLVAMLKTHGRRYRIDLAEARRLNEIENSKVGLPRNDGRRLLPRRT
jgi:restriction system protein